MEFKDYYKTMAVARDATQDDIKKAYRRLARKYHPDVSKEADAEARFKEIGEAYAVLRDPEKRASYDELGRNWKAGQEFHPPPDWNAGFEFTQQRPSGADASAFSDFFETLFGGDAGTSGGARQKTGFRGEDYHARVMVDLEDAYRGATRSIALRMPQLDESGRISMRQRNLKVRIPKGVRQGQRIRLAGQGSPGVGNAAAGDLFLEVAFEPHELYTVEGRDVYLDLPIAPWEAALGARIKTPTPGGAVDLAVPKGTRSGSKLRLKGRGIPGDPPGDLYVVPQVTLPPADSDAARDLYRKMEKEMAYNPRSKLGV